VTLAAMHFPNEIACLEGVVLEGNAIATENDKQLSSKSLG